LESEKRLSEFLLSSGSYEYLVRELKDKKTMKRKGVFIILGLALSLTALSQVSFATSQEEEACDPPLQEKAFQCGSYQFWRLWESQMESNGVCNSMVTREWVIKNGDSVEVDLTPREVYLGNLRPVTGDASEEAQIQLQFARSVRPVGPNGEIFYFSALTGGKFPWHQEFSYQIWDKNLHPVEKGFCE
jgi:hypothetical protein